MADITTITTDNGTLELWNSPDKFEPGVPAVPGAQMIYNGFQSILAVGAGDTGTWILSLILPRNYVYKIAGINMVSQSAVPLAVYQRGMWMITRSSPLPASGGLEAVGLWNNGRKALNQQGITVSAVPAIETSFSPFESEFPGAYIPCLDADGLITINWFTEENEAAVTTIWNIRLFRYTVEQWRQADIHVPQQILHI